MEEGRFRNKVYWFTFIFSLLVIWVHSYNSELYLGLTPHGEEIWKIEHFMGDQLGQISVPGFFLISSYLFFHNFTWASLGKKWLSRVRSILVPYVLWNGLYYLGYVAGSRMPVVAEVVGKGVVPFNLPTALEAILNYTYNYVFWYLYQLILLILLAPVIYVVMKNIYLGGLCLALLLAAIYMEAALPKLNLDALFYYSVAAYGGIHFKAAVQGGWTPKRGAAGLALLAVAALAYGWGKTLPNPGAVVVFTVLLRLLAPVGLWFLVSENLLSLARPWMKYNFFLYGIHFAFVRFLNKAGAMLFFGIPWLPLAIYAAMPFVVVFISHYIGRALRRWVPPAWRLLNGGRP